MRLWPRDTLAHSTNNLFQSVDLVGATPTPAIKLAPSRINFVAFHREFGSARLSAPAWNIEETPPQIERPPPDIEAATERTQTPLIPEELAGHRVNSASADPSLAPLDLKTLPIQIQSPQLEVTHATDRRRVREITIKTTTLDAHSTIAVITDIEVEGEGAILDTGLASHRIDFVASKGEDAPSRVASAPDQTKSSQDKIKRTTDRMNVADDDMKSTPIGLVSAGFGLDDALISSGVATDWFAPVLARNGVDLVYVAADPILDSALLNHDSHRVDETRAFITTDTTRFTGAASADESRNVRAIVSRAYRYRDNCDFISESSCATWRRPGPITRKCGFRMRTLGRNR